MALTVFTRGACFTMLEISVSSLEPRLQKQVENAQIALQSGKLDYAIEVAAQVLKQVPGCLPVRRLQRAALLQQAQGRSRLLSKAFGSVTQASFLFSGKNEPAQALEKAEKLLCIDPLNVSALKLMAEAAGELGLTATAAFAWEAVWELQPHDRETLLVLGGAWLAAGKPKDALRIADEILRQHPQDGAALALMREASVAETMESGGWGEAGSFREKLHDETQTISLAEATKAVASEDATLRSIEVAKARSALQPDNPDHHRRVADDLRKLGRYEEASEWIRRARQTSTGAADRELEKLEADLVVAALNERIQTLERLAADQPDGATAGHEISQARTELMRLRMEQARTFAERHPDDHAGRLALADLCFETGDFDGAIAGYQYAQKNPKLRLAALMGLGRALQGRRMFDLALTQFREVKRESSTMDDLKKEAIYRLAECLQAMGNATEAITEIKILYSEDIGYRDVAEKINAYYAKA